MKHIEKIFNAETGEETIVEREYTSEELAAMKKAQEEFDAELAEINAKKAARLAILDKLGLTEEEAKVLLG